MEENRLEAYPPFTKHGACAPRQHCSRYKSQIVRVGNGKYRREIVADFDGAARIDAVNLRGNEGAIMVIDAGGHV